MRILAVTHTLGLHGAALCLSQVLVALKSAGAHVDVVCPGEQDLSANLRDQGVGVLDRAQAQSYDVALVNTMPDFVRIQELSPFLPVVFWVHEGMSQHQPGAGMERWQPAFEACSRIVFQTPWQSQSVYKSFLQHVQPHRICHVPSGVHWPVQPAPRAQTESTRILFVGGIYPNKRPANLVQAVLRLSDLPIHCTLIGNADHLALNGQAMQDALRNHPQRFTLTGQIAQDDWVQQHYQQSHIFSLPSGDECSPRSVLEAAANALPLALSDLPCHEGIWKHGENALLSPVDAVDCLSWNLRALSQDRPLADRLSRAARATAQRFGMQQFLQSMTQIIIQATQDRVHSLPIRSI